MRSFGNDRAWINQIDLVFMVDSQQMHRNQFQHSTDKNKKGKNTSVCDPFYMERIVLQNRKKIQMLSNYTKYFKLRLINVYAPVYRFFLSLSLPLLILFFSLSSLCLLVFQSYAFYTDKFIMNMLCMWKEGIIDSITSFSQQQNSFYHRQRTGRCVCYTQHANLCSCSFICTSRSRNARYKIVSNFYWTHKSV